ncbi:MAG: hypothetical protein RLZZ32_1134 [Cyanobacteriota bacterium]|jgi:uncharacterized membrane protein YqhA|uniref:YqhA family protein n=1 Tax=Vulcanococcus sp. TaxID=2856995 RepID=UPI00322BFE12
MRRLSPLIEDLFERWLWKFRLIAIVPVVMSLLGSGATFVSGTSEIWHSIRLLLDASPEDSRTVAMLLGELVGGVDLYLIGIALMIFGYGVYELLISEIEAARGPDAGSNGLLDIRSLDALKEKLVKVIVVALIVSAFKSMLIFPIDNTTNLLVFSGSVLLLSLSAYLVAGGPNRRQPTDSP